MAGVAGLPILWELNTWTLFILGLPCSPPVIVPLTSTAFDVIGESQKTARFRVEFVVCRESSEVRGEVLSLLLFLWWVERDPLRSSFAGFSADRPSVLPRFSLGWRSGMPSSRRKGREIPYNFFAHWLVMG